jgi:CRP-like cAMP-binding protein
MKTVKVKSNSIVCKQDQECKSIYFIKSGRVKLVRDIAFHPTHKYESAKSNEIYREDPLRSKINPSQLIGKRTSEMSSISENPYNGTFTAKVMENAKPEIHSI